MRTLVLCVLVGSLLPRPATAQRDAGSDPFEVAESAREAYWGDRYADAAAGFARAAELAPHHAGFAFSAAVAWARAGRPDRALAWLDRAADLGWAVSLEEEIFEPLRGRPGFARVDARVRRLLEPVVNSEVAFDLGRRDLQPESVAYDPAGDRFYLGSIHRRKILRIERDGTVTELVGEGEHGLWGVLGMKVDDRRRRLWANACNLGREMPMRVMEPESVGRGAVFEFDLDSGELLDRHLAGTESDPVCFNDLTIRSDGDVFVSAGPDGVWRIDARAGRLRSFLRSSELWINGIASSGDERYLYLANGGRGVARVEIRTRTFEPVRLPANATLNGIDGLYFHRGALVGIQNGHRPKRVVRAALNATGDSVVALEVLDSNHPLYAGPTTGVIVRDTLFYVATAQVRALDDEGDLLPWDELEDNKILALPLVRR